jgi:DNA repair protein RecO (recombination protein O)
MIPEGLEAWVLHRVDSGETQAYVTFLTKEQGVIRAFCRSVRKKQALLQAFTPLWLTVDVKHDWYYVRQLEAISPSLSLRGDCLFSALYINELIYHTISPVEACSDLYDSYYFTLNALTLATQRTTIEALLRRFEWQLLAACGYQMSLTHDAHSNCPIDANQYYKFIPGEGLVVAQSGILGAHVLAFANNQFDNEMGLKSLKWMMRRAIDHVLDGKPIKARELYRVVQNIR